MTGNKKEFPISAAILAGGKNSRIATEKSLLRIRNIPLICGIVEILDQIFPEIIIVTDKEPVKKQLPGYIIKEDIFRNAGPLAGLHAALKAASNDAVFLFACDMPNLNPILIKQMLASYYSSADTPALLIPRHKSGYEPLHAIYCRTTLPLIQRLLAANDLKISNLYPLVKTSFFDIPEANLPLFYNINTKEDLQKLRQKQQ
jgi:molybdopterin-guanine dinucleotide biosynthesis protein A